LKSELKAQFSSWLKNPVILRGVQSGLKRSLALVDGDEASNTAKVQEAFDAYVDENFGNFRLDVYFIEEVKQALKKVGAQSIKVANISLGTSFEKSIAQLNPDDLEKEKESLLKFFMYELFKSEVARVATDYAPHTLFVIAAGNDGAWVDGRSRSALPCDLSAVYFEKFAQPGDESQIESQRLKNVLCVGSVGPEKEVSSFSNIPLTPIPFVFSYGEQIYSHIKTTDCTGAAQERSVLSGESPSYPSLTEYKEDVGLVPDERGIAFMKSIGVEAPATLKGKSRDRWLRDEYSRVREIYLGLWPELRDLTLYQRCLDDKAPAAKLSGTSMATPAVTGYIARRILEKMDQLGVQETQAYSMDEFSPARLIAELSAQQGTYGGNSILSKVPMIADIQKVLLAPMSDWPRVLGFESKGSWFFSQVRRGSLTTSDSHSSP
jgi:subtilisin family serine protease